MENTSSHTVEEPALEDSDRMPTFADLPLREPVRAAVEALGYVHPTPVQLATYEPAVKGRDIIVQSRTGTGKTAAFGIPLVDRLVDDRPEVQVLVLAPTRELALQSSRELSSLGTGAGIQTAAVYGGAPFEPQARQIAAGAQIVSGTPGRVLDHLGRGTLKPGSIEVLVLDEADEMLSMGFARELHAIMEQLPSERQTMMFSATADDAIQRMADRHMRDPEFISLSSDQVGATTIRHLVYFVSGTARVADLIRILESEDPASAIIFCNTKAETERVALSLQQAGFDADWISGDLSQRERETIMDRTRRGELRFMVATDVAARGIDISHLTHVLNYSFPEAVEQYIHRTGRTGRAGQTGTAISLVSPQELGSLYYLRLQYKIFPVERSLPNSIEAQTQRERDRIVFVRKACTAPPSPLNRAVARRVLSDHNAEQLVSQLLEAFFTSGGQTEDELDARAAQARREMRPERTQTSAAPRPRKTRPERTSTSEAPRPRRKTGHPAADSTPPSDRDAEMVRLYINLGKRDGVRTGDVARLFREQAELSREEIGRVRLRDKHAFVLVQPDAAERAIKRLHGQTAHDRELVVEVAKAGR